MLSFVNSGLPPCLYQDSECKSGKTAYMSVSYISKAFRNGMGLLSQDSRYVLRAIACRRQQPRVFKEA